MEKRRKYCRLACFGLLGIFATAGVATAAIVPYKAPKHVRFVDDLPRTPSGKVQKHKLRDAWTA